jgi:O-antigen ligase
LKKGSLIAGWRRFEFIAVILLLLWGELWDVPAYLFTVGNLIAYALVFILVGSRWKQIAYWLTKDPILVALVSLAAISVLWSSVPDITVADTRSLLRTTLFGAYFGTRFSFNQQLRMVAYALLIATVVTVMIVLAFPSYGIEVSGSIGAAWSGFFGGKQGLGRMMGIATISFISMTASRYPWFWSGCWAAAVLVLWFSKSQTALLALILFTLVRPFFKIAKQAYKTKTILTIVSLISIIAIAALLISNLEYIVVGLLGKNLEFNGRTPIWTLSIAAGLKRPFFGYGIAGFWPSEIGVNTLGQLWSSYLDLSAYGGRYHSHNGFLDLFMQLGAVGLGLYLIHLFGLLAKLFKKLAVSDAPGSFWALQMVLFQIFFNMTESMTMVANSFLWILYMGFSLRIKIESAQEQKSTYESVKVGALV